MSTVQVGQVWRDKDKRRNTVIEIIATDENTATGLIVGTEQERTYVKERLTKRWEMLEEKTTSPAPEVAEIISEIEDNDPEADPVPIKFKTREQYLEAAVKAIIKKVFTPADIEVPPVRVSVGWPGGRGPKKNVIGQCFDKRVSKDGVAQIFVTPAIDDSYVTIETLTHELIHAIVEGHEGEDGEVKHHGHRGEFIVVAKAIGFMKPWKETPATEELREKLQGIADKLGAYPHVAITMADRPAIQATYYLKYVSPEEPDYFVRVTATKIEKYGAPVDPWGNEMEEEVK